MTLPPTSEELIRKVAAEPDARLRRKLLTDSRTDWTPELARRIYDEVVRLLHVDIVRAERLGRAAQWLGQRMADPTSLAAGMRALAHIEYRRRKYEAAVQLYEQAREIYQQAGLELEAGRTLNSSIQSLIYLGQYVRALEYAARAREVFERHGDRLRLARLDANTGNILYRQDRFEEALVLYRRAYAAFLEIGEPQDVAISLKNTATCEISLNQFQEALDTYRHAREYCEQHDMPLLVAVADYNIAYLYYLRGEYTRSIELYRQARENCSAHGDAYREALCDLDQSEMYLELNLIEEGAHLARRAHAAFLALGMRYEAAKAQTNLAIALTHHGETDEAFSLFREARQLFRREDNRAWIATIDLYRALVLHQQRKLAKAMALCRRALDFFLPSPLFTKAVLSQLLLARIHLDQGDARQARAVCREAIDRLEREVTPALSYQAWYILGCIEEALGEQDSAYAAYKTAHQHLEGLRSHVRAEEIKIAFLKDKLEVYEALVRMSLERGGRGSLEMAFGYIEQAKSRSLADLIAFRSQGLPAHRKTERAVVEEVNSLRSQLNWYSRAIRSLEGRTANLMSPQLVKLRRAARQGELRLVEALAGARTEAPEYASLQGAGSVPLEAVRAALPEDAILIEYYRVRDRFHACVLSRKHLRIVPLGLVEKSRRIIQLLRFQLSKFRLGPDYVRTFESQLLDATRAHLSDFYRELVDPIEGSIAGAGHLIVAPHDFLHYLPFQAMIDGRGEYLGDRFSMSRTPSASVFYLCSTKQANSDGGSLILGIPDPAAPQIRDEVKAIAAALPGARIYVGESASYDVLRDQGAGARFVHIATHGEFRQDNPMFSSIRLGTTHLNLFDLYQLNLPCELVTLSGCGTGLNVVVGGDELLGLVRGLLYAGTQGVLVSLWDVNDQTTAQGMGRFYELLKHKKNKAKALQEASREIRREHPHPFCWAPFVLVGKYD